MSFRKVLVAVDESTHAARAAEIGADLAGQLQAELAFVHSFDVEDLPGGICNLDGGIDDVDAWREDALKMLHAFSERTKMTPAPLTFFENGKAAPRIIEVAKQWQADLIVIGTRGRSSIANALTGSVAQGVLHHASCPVLMVKD